MRVCVLGGGVAGVTTAYYLAREGCQVEVIERHDAPALEASYANGGQLSYSFVAPLAEPGLWKALPAWLLKRDSPLRFIPRLEPRQWSWCLRFLAACNEKTCESTIASLLDLGAYSQSLMHELVRLEAPEFAYRQTGKLVLYRSRQALAAARRHMEVQVDLGCRQSYLSAIDCVALEPALAPAVDKIEGGIHTPSEETGDCRLFCQSLARIAQERFGARFHFGESIHRLRLEAGAVKGIETSGGELQADAVVCALGMGSLDLMQTCGLRLPLYPLQGYSLTLPVTTDHLTPQLSVTDSHHRIVFAPFGDRLRIAGMVDVLGLSPRDRFDRITLLSRKARALLPQAGDYRQAETWTGRRPATPTSLPLLGSTPIKGLYLNTGQGALGFTLACASARLVADMVIGRPPALDMGAYRYRR